MMRANGGLIEPGTRIWDDDAGCMVPVVPLKAPDFAPVFAAIKQIVQVNAKAIKTLASHPTVLTAVRMYGDREHIRRIARRERQAALDHLDAHVDTIYADLGLERPR